MEVWKTIKGFENYQVSNLGRVKSLKRYVNHPVTYKQFVKERILKNGITLGYSNVTLSKDKKKYNFRVHRLVAESFIINTNLKPFVNHINGIKNDNRVENLEWHTISENTKHAYDIGLHKPYTGLKDKGNNKFYKEWNNLIKKGISMRKIAKQYGTNHRTVGNIVNKFNNLKINQFNISPLIF